MVKLLAMKYRCALFRFLFSKKIGALTGGQSAGAGLSEPVGHVTCRVTR